MTILAAPPFGVYAFTSSSSTVRIVALEGDGAPAEVGGTYSKIDAASIADSGEVAFSASLSGSQVSSAIFLRSNDSISVLARAGDPTPAGGRYKRFGELDFSVYISRPGFEGAGSFLLFHAEMEDGPSPEGIFLWTPDAVTTYILAGDRSPRGNIYKSFSQLTVIATSAIISGTVISRPLIGFVGKMEDGSKSVIIDKRREGEAPLEILSTQDNLGEAKVEDVVISLMGWVALSVVADLRKKNKRFKEALMITADSVFSGGLKEKKRIEGFGRIKRIIIPPTIRSQVGYIALESKSGTSGIAARDSFHQPIIIAKTGDPVPGLAAETIRKFGPPVTNSNFPLDSRFAVVVSTVRLSGGRLALWKYLFFNAPPGEADREETKILMFEGDSVESQNILLIRSFSPIKLTNQGMLLLRGAYSQGALLREGVFIMDGLFE